MKSTKAKRRSKKVRGLRRKFRNRDTLIPAGIYCYTVDANGKSIKRCPFWQFDKRQHPQEDGVCLAFGLRDAEEQGGLLWDLVKECRQKETC